MKIVEARVEESILPKKDKDWKFALAANPMTEGWIVSIRDEDGTVGYGYASTMNHYGAPHEAVKGALDRLCKRLIGRDAREIASIMDDLDHAMAGNNQAKSGIDCALHDLAARRLGVPICDLFGGPAVREFATLRILPIKSPADMAKNARTLARQGRAAFQDQGPRRGGGGRGAGRGDPRGAGSRSAPHHRRQPVVRSQGRDTRAQPDGAISHRLGGAAGEGERPDRAEGCHASSAGHGRGRRSGVFTRSGDDPGEGAHRRRHQPQDHQARRSAENIRRRTNLRRWRREVPARRACRADAAGGACACSLPPRFPASGTPPNYPSSMVSPRTRWEGLKLVDGVLHLSDSIGCGVNPKAGAAFVQNRRKSA